MGAKRRTYFEEEAATSTPSVIQQWIALVKPAFDNHIPEFDHEYLNLNTRSTVCVFITAGPIIKLCARGEGDSGLRGCLLLT